VGGNTSQYENACSDYRADTETGELKWTKHASQTVLACHFFEKQFKGLSCEKLFCHLLWKPPP
jgi:hypothetical protein